MVILVKQAWASAAAVIWNMVMDRRKVVVWNNDNMKKYPINLQNNKKHKSGGQFGQMTMAASWHITGGLTIT